MMRDVGKAQFEAVVFLTDRRGGALERRTRCLELARIPHAVQVETRASGKYYKLCVRPSNAVDAHLALQLGGCGRAARLQPTRFPNVFAGLRDIATSLWDELVVLVHRGVDYLCAQAPTHLLARSVASPDPPQNTEESQVASIAPRRDAATDLLVNRPPAEPATETRLPACLAAVSRVPEVRVPDTANGPP